MECQGFVHVVSNGASVKHGEISPKDDQSQRIYLSQTTIFGVSNCLMYILCLFFEAPQK